MTDPGPVETDILLNKLRPGHEMEMKLFAVKVVLLFSHNLTVYQKRGGGF